MRCLNISSPHPFRFLQQLVSSFQTMFLPPHRGTRHRTRKEVEHGLNRSNVAVYVQFVPVRVGLLYLFRCRHTYPMQIWIRLVDCSYDSAIVLFAELWLVGWGVSLNGNVRIVYSSPFLYQD